jgi:hypothetical protein
MSYKGMWLTIGAFIVLPLTLVGVHDAIYPPPKPDKDAIIATVVSETQKTMAAIDATYQWLPPQCRPTPDAWMNAVKTEHFGDGRYVSWGRYQWTAVPKTSGGYTVTPANLASACPVE